MPIRDDYLEKITSMLKRFTSLTHLSLVFPALKRGRTDFSRPSNQKIKSLILAFSSLKSISNLSINITGCNRLTNEQLNELSLGLEDLYFHGTFSVNFYSENVSSKLRLRRKIKRRKKKIYY